jgi:hypothetical protein
MSLFKASLTLVLLASIPVLATPTTNEHRTIDGSGNNLSNPEWGTAGIALLRRASSDYDDGLSAPSGGVNRPGPRAVSQRVHAQSELVPNDAGLSDFFWLWGQFLDHDIGLTMEADPAEPFPVEVPVGDPFFDPAGTGTQLIGLNRSNYDPSTGEFIPREQVNGITAFIDASNVYGSSPERASALRTLDGTGRLKTSRDGQRHYLPYNTDGLENAGGPSSELFLAGDIRANEHVGLTALHTLFVREHNRIVDAMRSNKPGLTGEELYQSARRIVAAEIQIVTYREFLPLLLGRSALPAYRGYDPTVNPGINNEFSTAAYRFGHSMVSPTLLRLKRNGRPIAEGNLALRDAFFSPSRIPDEGGLAPLMRGFSAGTAQRLDVLVVDDLRNFLFGPPGAGGFDLAALNIQRGRDHGLCDYNRARFDYGLPPVADFRQITSDRALQSALENAYASPDALDLWVGILAEDKLPGALVGQLGMAIIADQFRRLRDGDRFFYLNDFSTSQVAKLEKASRLSDIIVRNTTIRKGELPKNVFLVRDSGPREGGNDRRGSSRRRRR